MTTDEALAKQLEDKAFIEWDNLINKGYSVPTDDGRSLDWSNYLSTELANITIFDGDELDEYVETIRSIIGV